MSLLLDSAFRKHWRKIAPYDVADNHIDAATFDALEPREPNKVGITGGDEPSNAVSITWSSDDCPLPKSLFNQTNYKSDSTIIPPVSAIAGTQPAIVVDLASFDKTSKYGGAPIGALIEDAAGDLFGTTNTYGAFNCGAAFEIAKVGSNYAAPTLIASFTYETGMSPYGGLVADAIGNLFGTTYNDGPSSAGTVFEIAKTATGYASSPTVLVASRMVAYSTSSLIIDSAGNLFGTSSFGGAWGTVFEVRKTASGYSATPKVLASFNQANGDAPSGALAVDAQGDLFGTAQAGGPSKGGTVFEIPKTATGYGKLITLFAFDGGAAGRLPNGNIVVDTAGDILGTTRYGGLNDTGAVFELVKTASGYDPTPTVYASPGDPEGGLVADAVGNLYGTNSFSNGGVFEMVKTASGYAAPGMIAGFDGANGSGPSGPLMVDTSGHVFGTTVIGGRYGSGTVFELADKVSWLGSTGSSASPSPGNFNVGANWDAQSMPTSQEAVLLGAGAYSVLDTVSTAVLSLDIEAGALLKVQNTLTTTSGMISGAGTLQILSGGSMSSNANGAQIAPTVLNGGTVNVTNGTLDVTGVVKGAGSFLLGSGTTLEFGAAVSNTQTIGFGSQSASLLLDQATSFKGVLWGFASGDSLALSSFSDTGLQLKFAESASGTAGTLSITSGSQHAAVALTGVYSTSQFTHIALSGGGTSIGLIS